MTETRETRSQNFTAIYHPFAVAFVKVSRNKTFWIRIFARRTFFCLDVIVYRLNCVFWWLNLLEIEFKSRDDTGSGSIMHSGITHER